MERPVVRVIGVESLLSVPLSAQNSFKQYYKRGDFVQRTLDGEKEMPTAAGESQSFCSREGVTGTFSEPKAESYGE